MAESIQFPCPSCGAALKLLREMAAVQGPCPLCHQKIIAPDPARDLAARIFTPEPPPTESESSPNSPAPAPAAQRGTRWFPLVLTAAISLLAGYFIGGRSRTNPPSAIAPMEIQAAPAVTGAPEPAPEAPEPASAPAPEPLKASAAAEHALKAFLDAPDWATRAAHVLSPETVRPAMKAYSRTVPDGPTPYESISVENSYTDKATGNTLFIFKLVTANHPSGIPVAVAESDDGWQVDWQTFIEFRDDLFQSFAEGPIDETGRFHVIVSSPPTDQADTTENEHFSSFLLEPPMPGRQQLAYAKRPSELHTALEAATADGAAFTPVLEVSKRKTPEGTSYLAITRIVANDWLPENR